MWELDPVEVRARTPAHAAGAAARDAGGVGVQRRAGGCRRLPRFPRQPEAGADRQPRRDHPRPRRQAAAVQPARARRPAQTIGAAGTIYDVSHLQMFQADLIRSLGGTATPRAGRRVLAQKLHDPRALNPPLPPGAPAASVELGGDGSMAALVPAERALTWHLTDAHRHAGGARALLAHLPARRDPRLHLVPRPQQSRPVEPRQHRAAESARGAAQPPAVVEEP